MEVKDSGARRKFETGAVRDIAEGKGRCDLLPLLEIGDHLGSIVLIKIGMFLKWSGVNHITEAVREFINVAYGSHLTAILELSKQYEAGAKKYEERNWEKGIPTHCFVDSGVRHYLKWMRGDDDEPHDRAFLWNMFGLLWTIRNHPELDDLPYTNKQ